MLIVAVVLGAFLICFFLVPFMVKRAKVKNLLDVPNERSSHTVPTPRNGGVGIVCASVVAALLVMGLKYSQIEGASIGLLGVLVAGAGVGFADDRLNLPTKVRMLAYLVCAIGAVFLGAYSTSVNLPGLGGFYISVTGGMIFSVLFIAWYTNLFNFMDGIDGIAAGAALVIFCALGFIFIANAESTWGLIALGIAGAVSAFLVYNMPPAVVFMGDGGAVFLGLSAGALSLVAVQKNYISIVAVVFFMFPFVFDATFTLIRRALKREKIWAAHRSHIYQQLCDLGFSHKQISFSYTIIAALLAIFGLFYDNMSYLLQAATGWSVVLAFTITAFIVVKKNA